MIVAMKKAKIVMLKDDLEKVLKEIQRASCLMIVKQEANANQNLSYDGLIARSMASLKVIESNKKKSLGGDYIETSFDELDNIDENTLNCVSDIEFNVNEIQRLKAEINNINDEIDKNLYIWYGLEDKISSIKNTKYSKIHMGFIDTKKLEQFSLVLDEYGSKYYLYGQTRNQQAVLFVNFVDDDEAIMEKVKGFNFTEVKLENFDMTIKDVIEEKKKEIESLEKKIKQCETNLASYEGMSLALKLYIDHLLMKQARNASDFAETLEVNVIDGWVPSDKVDLLKEAIERATSYYDIELTNPTSDDDVPTYAENKKIVEPFESITNMFSVPDWKEIDPNPVMSIWYWLLFGMMMGDFGYGLVMLIAGILFIKLLHPRKGTLSIAKIITYSGISTMIWGIIFNSFFGATFHDVFSFIPAYHLILPMEDSMTMLILSVIVGAFHILTGIVMKMIKDLKARNILEFLGKDLSWFLILAGGGVAAVGIVLTIDAVKFGGIGAALLGVVLILFFAGHEKKNIVGKAVGGLAGLYDITGYFGDLLSYTRIMALVMSSASVAFVMNTLAGMLKGNVIGWIFAIIVYIVGHVFNIVLGLLSAYVHDCRLQYIEFYGKFYDGGGKLFKPLTVDTKYVNEIKK